MGKDKEKKPLLSSEERFQTSYGSGEKSSHKKAKPPKKPKRPLSDLFRYATCADYALIIFGCLFSIVHGVGFPIISIIFGGMTDTFLKAQKTGALPSAAELLSNNTRAILITNFTSNYTEIFTKEMFLDAMTGYALYYVYIGLGMFAASYGQIACWQSACERQVYKLRKQFFHAILRQEISWFDKQQSGELTTRLSDDLERIKEGIGDKFSLFIQYVSAFFAGFIVGFIYSWKLTLVMMSLTPLLAASGAFMAKMMASATTKEQEKYAKAGAIAEEVLSCARTVIAFNGQKQEVDRYKNALAQGKVIGVQKYLYMGAGLAVSMIVMFGSYALAFWYGSILILGDDHISSGTVFTVFFSVMAGSSAIGNAAPHLSSLSAAQGAAAIIYDIIDVKPKIDPYSEVGTKPTNIKGKIEFKHVSFSYPTRKDIPITKDLSFVIEPGKTIALVGPSGCGKSTAVNLILRFYDADSGQILIDENDIKSLNIHYLREQIGVVSQEPILFDATVEENIRYGQIREVTREDVERAAKMANAHDFISKLPNAYKTRVGERGTQLSGGQKQRIAIARALIRDPKILLLDEATSALDAESEGIVQEALEKAQQGRTTLVIAHRLSTIQNADRILAIRNGEIAESGSHHELMALKGLYYDLVMAQSFDDVNADVTISESDANNDSEMGASNEALRSRRKKFSSARTLAQESPLADQKKSFARSFSTLGKQMSHRVSKSGSVVSLNSTVMAEKRLRDELEEEKLTKASLWKIIKENRPEYKFLFTGLASSILNGSVMPLFALFYSQIFQVYSLEGEELKQQATFWSLMFLVLGFIQGLTWLTSMYFFGQSGENLTMRLRTKVFSNVLRQDVAYFDDEKHATGKICTRLATDAPNVRFAFGGRMATVVSATFSMIAGVAIGFIFGWKMALVVIAMLPILIASGFLDLKLKMSNQTRDTKLMEEAGKVASEGIENVRTVQAITKEKLFYELYCAHLLKPYQENLKQAEVYAFAFSFSQCVIYFMYAAAFRYGAFLVGIDDMVPLDVYRVFFALSFCGMSIGQTSAFIPDYVKARLSAALIFHMIEYPSRIDSYGQLGLKPELNGSIVFNDVYFNYPSRPGVRVLRGLSLSVKPGQTVALVGPSGCGKSTVVALIERFYNPAAGQILIDDHDIKTLNIGHLRSYLSLVSQEPILFDCSIRDNIAYGVTGSITQERIVQAAKLANIHEFIIGLPLGYNTNVGEKGTQLSGGQKQRIAIARALVRNPKILLLDEATSALDTESEKIVQEALDKAREGRTCVVIAHRLSTVQNADCICVIKDGKVVEKGTHAELLARKGVYFNLTRKQNFLKES